VVKDGLDNPPENMQIFERMLEDYNREGVEGAMRYFSDDVEVFDPDLPDGDYRGANAARRVIELLESGFDDVEVRDFRLLPVGDRVVALIHTRSRGQGEEGPKLELEMHTAHTITFQEGKVSYWRLYDDQGEALSDAGLDPELASPQRS
jgi:ketosteroid isomerase-like protein